MGKAGLSFGADSVHSPLMSPDVLRSLPFPILGVLLAEGNTHLLPPASPSLAQGRPTG